MQAYIVCESTESESPLVVSAVFSTQELAEAYIRRREEKRDADPDGGTGR